MGNEDSSYREKLGIKAAVRAQFFHRDQEHAVSFDAIDWLSDKGSDLLMIEKEGVAEILQPYASKKGIAVLNTRGFAVEYAKQIMRLAELKRGNVFLLTDWDVSGLIMAQDLQGFTRIGVDEKLIREASRFSGRAIRRIDIEESYSPKEKDLKTVKDEAEREKVAETRVEIDSLLAAAGPGALWKAIESTIVAKRRVRDLTRSMAPEIRLPKDISEPLDRILDYARQLGTVHLAEKMRPVKRWRKGLVDIASEEETIENAITERLSRESSLRELVNLLQAITDYLIRSASQSQHERKK